MEIRKASAEDLEALVPLIAEYQRFYGSDPGDEQRRQHFSKVLADDQLGTVFLALDRASAVGFATLYFPLSTVRANRYCLMNDLYVTPANRGSGIGRSLIERCREFARSEGLSTLTWNTEQLNHKAQALYDSFGAHREAWYAYVLPAERPVDQDHPTRSEALPATGRAKTVSHPDQKLDRFRALHFNGTPLVLLNVWDSATARIVEESGAKAIATTSAGIAASLGYPDGEFIQPDQMLTAVARIASAVKLPVTADMESGYGFSKAELRDLARALRLAGVAGINFEDSQHTSAKLRPLDEQTERIASLREALSGVGYPLFINARIDTYLLGSKTSKDFLEETILRAVAYCRAGADGIFVPGVWERDVIARLVQEIPAPLNLLWSHAMPSLEELADLGVARLSVGSALMRSSLEWTRQAVARAMQSGSFERLHTTSVSYDDLNHLMAGGSPPAQGLAHTNQAEA